MIARRVITMMFLLFSVLLVTSCAEKKAPPAEAAITPPPAQTAAIPPVQASAEKATTSIATVEKDIAAMTSQINSTNAALNQVLVSKGTPQAKTAFAAYSTNVTDMNRAAQVFVKDSDQMTVKGNDYFREWAKSGDVYTNPQIQQLNEARRSELMNTFSQITGPSAGVKDKVNAYLSQINQLRTYLSRDLSATGIETVSPVAEKTINDGQQIIADSQPMLAAAQQARAQIGEVGAATGGAPAPYTGQ